jgi:hypothetical protein
MSQHSELEHCVAQVELRLSSLGEALRVHHAEAVETEAAALQQALVAAVERLRASARSGRLPSPLRQRLALAGASVAAQRDSLARAGASLDRAIEVLLPSTGPRVAYSAAGVSERAPQGGAVQA